MNNFDQDKSETGTPLEPKKFLGCFSIERGQTIIGVLEFLALLLQLFNMTYSVRVSLGMLLVFNVPLLTALYFRYKNNKEENYQAAYKWNTVFLTIYSLRLVAFVVMGLVFLVWATNHRGPVEFLCNRYYELKLSKKSQLDDVEECREELRILGWLIYFPVIFFQVHCVMTLNLYRKQTENKRFIELTGTGEEEDI